MIENGQITAADGFDHLEPRVCRVPSRISDLKQWGFPITTELYYYKNKEGELRHYAIYRIKRGVEE